MQVIAKRRITTNNVAIVLILNVLYVINRFRFSFDLGNHKRITRTLIFKGSCYFLAMIGLGLSLKYSFSKWFDISFPKMCCLEFLNAF